MSPKKIPSGPRYSHKSPSVCKDGKWAYDIIHMRSSKFVRFVDAWKPLQAPAFDVGALLLRVVFGALMLTHGWPKLMQFFGDKPLQFMDPLGIGVGASLVLATFAEFFCAILVIVGAATRPAALVLAVNMAVAVYALGDVSLGAKELALLYFGAFAAIALIGPGRVSVCHWGLSRMRKKDAAAHSA